MFPDNNQTSASSTNDVGAPTFSGAPAPHMTPVATNTSPFATPDPVSSASDKTAPSFSSPASDGGFSTPQPSSTPAPAQDAPAPAADLFSDVDGPSFLDDVAAPTTAPSVGAQSDDHQAANIPDDLLKMKQGALEQLEPLVDKLDQTPEEAFKTTMMMIQATDNQELLQKAYEQAQKIDDEKVRAQALLDVINEINYFSSQKQPAADN